MIRTATKDDIDAMVSLVEADRIRRQAWEPQFWRKAETSAAASRDWFTALLEKESVAAFISHPSTPTPLNGFVIASLIDAPPVYAPGGKTCMIDDYSLADDSLWSSVGQALLDAAKAWAKERGAVQTVVVAATRHDDKKSFLAGAGLSQASTWWVGRI